MHSRRNNTGEKNVLNHNRVFLIVCHGKGFLCAFASEQEASTPKRLMTCSRAFGTSAFVPHGAMALGSQEDCSAAGLPGNSAQIGCNCWY